MTNEEKRTTGKFHHTDPLPHDYNPVQYSRYYWLKIYLFMVAAMVIIYLVITHLFN